MSSYVFNTYLYNLSKKTDTFYNPNNFDIWLCPRAISIKNNNRLDMTFDSFDNTFNPDYMTYLGNIGNMSIQVTDNAAMPSDRTYQEIFNIPVSGYLFSKDDCPNDIPFKRDFVYSAFDYSVYDAIAATGFNGNFIPQDVVDDPLWKDARLPHFETEYGFSSAYDSTEYIRNFVPEEPLLTNNVSINTDNLSLSSDMHNCLGGALLLSYYDGKRVNDYNKNSLEWPSYSAECLAHSATPTLPLSATSGYSIPCIYFELQKTYKLNNAVINIQWSENGLFRFS